MKNPLHFGRLVRQECLEPLGLTVIQGAKILGVTRKALNNLVNCLGNGKPAISPEMAIRPDKAFINQLREKPGKEGSGGGVPTYLPAAFFAQ